MKILTVVGARPQFIKAAAVSRAIGLHNRQRQDAIHEVIVHTGQHFDANMSQVFFDELAIPRPDYNLGVASLSHGALTGRIMEGMETLILQERPSWVLVYGDTNSTLAGALAAVKVHVPVAHVEAGLRSFNMRMPEEVNRVLSDRISTRLFCPSKAAVENLAREGITDGVYQVGDVMYDTTLLYREMARHRCALDRWAVSERNYVLCTIHRAENTDDASRFREIWAALEDIATETPVVFPAHPRTRKLFPDVLDGARARGISVIEPVSYLEMMRLEMSARAIVTDSGGVQKEAFFHRVPCLTVRDETEWTETVEVGWNILCGADRRRILAAWNGLDATPTDQPLPAYGDGNAAHHIVESLACLKSRSD